MCLLSINYKDSMGKRLIVNRVFCVFSSLYGKILVLVNKYKNMLTINTDNSSNWTNWEQKITTSSAVLLNLNPEETTERFRYSKLLSYTEEMYEIFCWNKTKDSNDFLILSKYLTIINELKWLDNKEKAIIADLTTTSLSRLIWKDITEMEEWILELISSFKEKVNIWRKSDTAVEQLGVMKNTKRILELNN